MVEILVPTKTSNHGCSDARGTPLAYRPSPVLETPHSLPQFITSTQKVYKSYQDECKDNYLTDLLHSISDLKHEIHIYPWNDMLIPIINQPEDVQRYAVGPRLSMLHKRYSIGNYLIHLLSHSPIHMLTPDLINWEAHGSIEFLTEDCIDANPRVDYSEVERKKKKGHNYGFCPEWVKANAEDNHTQPTELPILCRLIRECEDAIDELKQYEFIDISNEEFFLFPALICTWYGLEPWYGRYASRFLHHMSDYGPDHERIRREELTSGPPDQGGPRDPSWMLTEDMTAHYTQTGAQVTSLCYALHTREAQEHVIYLFRPFYDLLKYISYAND